MTLRAIATLILTAAAATAFLWLWVDRARGELNAIAHAYMGTDYSDIFTQELLERECGCAY